MTQKDQELLLKDLCTRLPYGVKCKDQYGDYIDVNIYNAHIEHLIDQILSGVIKMVLRPMSSMTEEEKTEYRNIAPGIEWNYGIQFPTTNKMDWLNAHHFDYRGLIPMGLALEAPERMYNLNEK